MEILLVSVGSLVLACVTILALAWLNMKSWEHSLTLQMETLKSINSTLELSSKQFGDTSQELDTKKDSAFSGSSNSSQTDDHTSTFIPILESSDTGSARHGIASLETAIKMSYGPAPESNLSDLGEKAKSHTLSNMPQKMSKKSCRLCLRVRKLVGFGV